MTAHVAHKCSDGTCDRAWCARCSGALFLCAVCGGAEASLPTDCPSVLMTEEQEQLIVAGSIDYIRGCWEVHSALEIIPRFILDLRETQKQKAIAEYSAQRTKETQEHYRRRAAEGPLYRLVEVEQRVRSEKDDKP